MEALQKVFGYGFSQAEVPSLVGKTFIVTGGSNGIGLSVARTLYSHGARVIVVGAQQAHLSGALVYIKTGDLAQTPETYRTGFGSQADNSADGGKESGEVEGKLCEFKNLDEVAKLAKELAGSLDRLDGLVLLAGLGVNKFELTKDGYDSHLTVNAIANIVLLSHLLPVLEKTSQMPETDVRVVIMSSELHRATFGGPGETWGGDKFRDEAEFKKDCGPNALYARSKLADILIIKARSRRLTSRYDFRRRSSNVTFSRRRRSSPTLLTRTDQYKPAFGQVVGTVMETLIRPLMRAPDDGALSALWAATAPEARNGDKFHNGDYFSNPGQEGGETNEAKDQELIDNFWNQSVKIIEKVAGKDGLGPFVKA
ncbi:hypothetical protein JCM1840_001962 [Sporobolomyces johnsonii]